MHTRTPLLLLLVLLAAACGGGSAAPTGQPVPDPDPLPSESEVAQSLLENCGAPALAELSGFVALFADLAEGTAPGISVISFSPAPLRIDVKIDLDADATPDGVATLRFETPVGDPTSPAWTVQQIADLLANGIAELPALLATLDGIVLVIDATLTGPPQLSGTLGVLYTAGQPDTATGMFSVVDDPCQTQFLFEDVSYAGLLATPPSAALTATITDGLDTLAGDVVMDGTNTASAHMRLNGGAPMDFTLDLTTGQATPVP